MINDDCPVAMKKGELYELMNKKGGIAIRTLKNELYDVITKLRKVSRKDAKDAKDVRQGEVIEMFNRFK